MLTNEGSIGFIVPNHFLSTKYDKSLRSLIFKDNYAKIILNTGSVFESVNVETLIFIGEKSQPDSRDTTILNVVEKSRMLKDRLLAISNELWTSKNTWIDSGEEISITLSEVLAVDANGQLGNYVTFSKGMQPYEEGKGNPIQTRAMMDQEIYHSNQKIDMSYLPLLTASSVKRYQIKWEDKWIKYGNNLAAPRKKAIFEGPRILLNRIMVRGLLNAVYIDKTFINNSDIFNIIPKNNTDEIMMKAINAIVSSHAELVFTLLSAFLSTSLSKLIRYVEPNARKTAKIAFFNVDQLL